MKGFHAGSLAFAESITLKDVAQAARVSISTASRVLSQVPGFAVKEETRQRIMDAANTLNYRHNTVAKTLRSKRTNFVGLFLQDIESGTVPILLDGMQQAAKELGYKVLIHWARDGVELQQTACEWLAERRIDGVIFSTVMIPEECLRDMDALNLPYVMMGHSAVTERFATEDDRGGLHAIVEHLHNLGHRNIAYMSGPISVGPYGWRLECFKQALADFDLPFRQELVVGGGFGSWSDGSDCLHRLLRGSLPFTAIVGATANLTIGALSSACRCGLRVPNDLSLAAFHDTPLNTLTLAPITAVRTPISLVCHAAMRLMDDSLNNLPVRHTVVPGVELIVRGSTGPASRR